MLEFKDGDQLSALYFIGEGSIKIGGATTKIEVIMECGQMSLVPWFAVFEGTKMIAKYNGAVVEGVGY